MTRSQHLKRHTENIIVIDTTKRDGTITTVWPSLHY